MTELRAPRPATERIRPNYRGVQGPWFLERPVPVCFMGHQVHQEAAVGGSPAAPCTGKLKV